MKKIMTIIGSMLIFSLLTYAENNSSALKPGDEVYVSTPHIYGWPGTAVVSQVLDNNMAMVAPTVLGMPFEFPTALSIKLLSRRIKCHDESRICENTKVIYRGSEVHVDRVFDSGHAVIIMLPVTDDWRTVSADQLVNIQK